MTLAPLTSPVRYRVVSTDRISNHGPYMVEYYRGTILGGRWISIKRRANIEEPWVFDTVRQANALALLLEDHNPGYLNTYLTQLGIIA